MSSGKKRTSVASRYLAAIHCPAEPIAMQPSNLHRDAPLSPQTTQWKSESESFGSSKQSSIIQTRSTGNSPSSSRRSRASRTPPRDSAVDLSCHSMPQLRTSLFPVTSSGLVKHEIEDTDGSSLTSQGTPPLYDEDDNAALLMKETRDRINSKLIRPYRLQKTNDNDWRSRMDGTANYRKQHGKAAPPQRLSPRRSPTREEAPTEVMMNLSSIRQSEPSRKALDVMTDVTGTSTEIITNRAVDLHRRIRQDVDERDTAEPSRRPQHLEEGRLFQPQNVKARSKRSSRKGPPVTSYSAYQRRMPIEINSLLSDTSAELTEESTAISQTAVYPGSMPMGRLGRHVVQQTVQQDSQVAVAVQKKEHQRADSKTSFESFQEQSLTSSVGVETGVHVVPKSAPALKRVFKETQPSYGISVQQARVSVKTERRPLSPQREEEEVVADKYASQEEPQGDYKVPRISEFPPRAPLSMEKGSITSNPFMVRYSAKDSPPTDRRGLYDIASHHSDASSGGWTPVPLSSSGMISEDFVLDPDRTPMGKDVQPLQALFSADRVPSSSRSPLEKFYRSNQSNGESYDSVGPPDIHRVTTEHPLKTNEPAPQDAPGVIAGDAVQNVMKERRLRRLTPENLPVVESPQVLTAPAAIPENVVLQSGRTQAVENDGDKPSTKSLPHNRAWRRDLLRRRQKWLPQKKNDQNDDDGEGDFGEDVSVPVTAERPLHDEAGQRFNSAMEQPRTDRSSPTSSVRRNLFPSVEPTTGARPPSYRPHGCDNVTPDGMRSGDTHAVSESDRHSTEIYGDHSGLKASIMKSSSVRERVTSFSSSKKTTHQYVPPWKAKIREKESSEKEKKESPAVSGKKHEYIPPWKLELMKKKRSAKKDKTVDADEMKAPTFSQETTQEYIPPWKLELMRKRGLKMNDRPAEANKNDVCAFSNDVDRGDRGDGARGEGIPTERPKDTSEFTPSSHKTPLSVRDRANAFSTSRESTSHYVPPWVAKAKGKESVIQKPEGINLSKPVDNVDKMPAAVSQSYNNKETMETYVVKSGPQPLSVRDRAPTLSRDTGNSLRSKRSFGDTLEELSNPTGDGIQGRSVVFGEAAGDESPRKTMKISPYSQNARRSRVANLLGAVSAVADTSVTSNPSAEEFKTDDNKTPRKSLVLAAHLAATVDDVSPQDRYRRRFQNTDETTATDGSQEISDVQSLRSFFEGSLATAPSDEDEDSDDRTVESLRSKFETVPEKEEEPSAVSKMRAMFEKPKKSVASKKEFGGNEAVSDAFTKFQPDTPRWTPSSSANKGAIQAMRSLKQSQFTSPENEAVLTSSARKAVVTSAPSKLQSTSAFARSPPKPEDSGRRREARVTVDKTEEENTSAPQRMSVAERIRALKLAQSPSKPACLVQGTNDVSKQAAEHPSASAQNTKEEDPAAPTESPTVVVSHLRWKGKQTVSVSPKTASKDQPPFRDTHTDVQPERSLRPAVQADADAQMMAKASQGASFRSVKDRINAFSGKSELSSGADNTLKSSAAERPRSSAHERKSWPPNQSVGRQNIIGGRSLGARAIDRNMTDGEQAQQVHSIPSDEKVESGKPVGMKPVKSETSEISCDGSSGTDGGYDDGVTLDLSIADVSQLTNPTCLQSKEGGAAESSSEGDGSSEHTSDVGRGANTDGKGPSEASSSQASEAAVPLIARMKFSDDTSSVNSAKGVFPGRSKSVQHSARWEPLTPVVDETEVARESPDGTHESAWSPDEINATFPVESNFGSTLAAGDKLWQPFQAENWDNSPAFRSNWTPPSNVDLFETTVSEATSFGRLSENTPVRRNTARRASPHGDRVVSPTGVPSPEETKRSPLQGSPFTRTHPTRSEPKRNFAVPAQSSLSQHARDGVEAAPRSSPTQPATPRSSATKVTAVSRESASSSPPASAGISKQALLMSKLRSLKEARMRRNAAAGFHRSSVYPSEPQTSSQRPPTGNARGSPPASALTPFLRPGFVSSRPSRSTNMNQYCERRPESSPITMDDEQSASTKSSTQFGGHVFVESLEID